MVVRSANFGMQNISVFWNNWQGPLNTRSWSWRTDKISQPHSNQFLSHVRTYIDNEIARIDMYFIAYKEMLEIPQVLALLKWL